MSHVRFSIIVPTVGRPSLYATLASIAQNGIQADDEVLVVGDGPQPEARAITSAFLEPKRLNLSYQEIPLSKGVGGPARTHAIRRATGTHLLFMDDDDVYALGALLRMRERVRAEPSKVLIFKMRAMAKRLPYDVLWRAPRFEVGNLGTPMFVVPNKKGFIPDWPSQYCGDFAFLSNVLPSFGGPGAISWVDDVIAEINR